jgi:hypothetical protein
MGYDVCGMRSAANGERGATPHEAAASKGHIIAKGKPQMEAIFNT